MQTSGDRATLPQGDLEAAPPSVPADELSRRNGLRLPLEALAVGLVAALSAVLGTWKSSAKSFWLDEAWAVLIADGSWSEMWTSVTTKHIYQGFYYVLLHGWMGLFGESEFAVRGLSAAFGVATIVALYALGRSLIGRWAALTACLLLAVTAYFIRYQQEARGYTLLLFLLTLSSYMLVKGVRDGDRWVWPVYVLCGIAAVYTHLFSLWVFLVHFIVLVVAGTALKRLVLVYGAVAAGSFSMIRWFTERGVINPDWIPSPSIPYFLNQLRKLVFDEPLTIALFGTVLVVGVAMSTFHVRRSGRAGWPLLLVLLWATLPIFGPFLVSYVHPMLTARYLIVALPGLALLAGWCVVQLRPALVQVVVVVALVGAAVPAMDAWYAAPGDDWRGAARYVIQHARPGDGIMAIRPQPWAHYSEALRDEGYVPPTIPQDGLNREAHRRYDRVWLVIKKARRSPVRTRLDSSEMIRRRFKSGAVKGWLYRWPEDPNQS